jgi:hypothetical protein
MANGRSNTRRSLLLSAADARLTSQVRCRESSDGAVQSRRAPHQHQSSGASVQMRPQRAALASRAVHSALAALGDSSVDNARARRQSRTRRQQRNHRRANAFAESDATARRRTRRQQRNRRRANAFAESDATARRRTWRGHARPPRVHLQCGGTAAHVAGVTRDLLVCTCNATAQRRTWRGSRATSSCARAGRPESRRRASYKSRE